MNDKMAVRVKLLSVARTDVGRRHRVNEDALFRDDARGFYVVADGVGGHNKGEIASREAVEQRRMWVCGADRDPTPVLRAALDVTLVYCT